MTDGINLQELTTMLAASAQRDLANLAKSGDHSEQVMLPNGRGVSIIRNDWSYGGRHGLFEVAVLDANGDLDYSTPVTGDVLGHLTVVEVVSVMKQVAALPAAIEA